MQDMNFIIFQAVSNKRVLPNILARTDSAYLAQIKNERTKDQVLNA